MQNGFVESFNGRLRDECLNEHLVSSLRHARHLIAAWRDDYNHHRPHTSLEGLTPQGVPQPVNEAPNHEQNQLLNEDKLGSRSRYSRAQFENRIDASRKALSISAESLQRFTRIHQRRAAAHLDGDFRHLDQVGLFGTVAAGSVDVGMDTVVAAFGYGYGGGDQVLLRRREPARRGCCFRDFDKAFHQAGRGLGKGAHAALGGLEFVGGIGGNGVVPLQ